MIPTALYDTLSTLVDDRCYPVKLPERATFPAITYFQVSGVEGNTHDGYDHTSRQRWQISCWAETYAACRTLAEAVKLALRTFSGGIVEIVSASYMENQMDLSEPDVKLYTIPVDFFFLVHL